MAVETVGIRTPRQRNSNGGASAPIVLGPHDSLKGTLRTENGITIQGDVEGEIFATGDVLVESSATVVASIEARNVDIRGQVTGNVRSTQRLSLSGSGTLQGDASAARLSVEDGATLNGSISMSGARDVSEPVELPLEAHGNGESHSNGESSPEG
jgi:cytoskeletal protein CcmA (bactofilin family)